VFLIDVCFLIFECFTACLTVINIDIVCFVLFAVCLFVCFHCLLFMSVLLCNACVCHATILIKGNLLTYLHEHSSYSNSDKSIQCMWPRVNMAALWNRAGHYIFALWFLLSSSSMFYLLVFSSPNPYTVADWMSAYFLHTWCDFSANLRCRSETCCTRLAANTGRKNTKNRHLSTIAQLCRAISSQLRHISTIGKTC